MRIALIAAALLLTLAAGCGEADESDESSGERRSVETTLGAVEIPAEPQRVAVDWVTFDNLLALGFDTDRIVGVFELDFFLDNPELSPHLAQAAIDAGIEGGLGGTYEPDLERLLAVEPDLILVAEDQAFEESLYGDVQKIAPLVIYDLPEGEKSFAQWQSGLRSLAAVLGNGAEAKADEVVSAFDIRIEEIRTEHTDVIDELEVSTAKLVEDSITLSMPGRNLGTEVLTALGLSWPAAQLELTVDEYNTVELSRERIFLLDADLLFVEQRQESVAFIESDPLYQQLDVVKRRNVFFVKNYWEYGGAGSAMHVLDDIDAALDEATLES